MDASVVSFPAAGSSLAPDPDAKPPHHGEVAYSEGNHLAGVLGASFGISTHSFAGKRLVPGPNFLVPFTKI